MGPPVTPGNSFFVPDPKPKYKPNVLIGLKPSERKTDRSKCSHCKRFGWHKDADCLELDANKDKRPADYKPAAAGL